MTENPVRILIVEDEPIISRDIRSTLLSLGYEVVGMARDSAAAVDIATQHRPNVVLMDIKLKEGPNGIETAKIIRKDLGIPVIFLTANSDQVTVGKAKVAEPYGFVVKPFTDKSLHTAIEIALAHHAAEMRVHEERDRLYDLIGDRIDGDHLFVKNKGRQVRIRIKDITYLEALKDYVGIHIGNQRYVVHSTLQEMEARMPAKLFMRIHRSFVVRLDKISSVEDGQVTLENESNPVPIGGSFLGKVRERLDPL